MSLAPAKKWSRCRFAPLWHHASGHNQRTASGALLAQIDASYCVNDDSVIEDPLQYVGRAVTPEALFYSHTPTFGDSTELDALRFRRMAELLWNSRITPAPKRKTEISAIYCEYQIASSRVGVATITDKRSSDC